jgi:hypothetical protein
MAAAAASPAGRRELVVSALPAHALSFTNYVYTSPQIAAEYGADKSDPCYVQIEGTSGVFILRWVARRDLRLLRAWRLPPACHLRMEVTCTIADGHAAAAAQRP